MKKQLVWPDYTNCITNLPNSILKKFGVEPVGATLPLFDKFMDKEYKNVVVLLLDGMGKVIIEKHLKEDGPFRTHLEGIYNSVFLSTTVAATTSVMSGLQPCEHGWLGWECYYPPVDKNVVVFLNYIQGTEIPAADYNLAWTYTPYENIMNKINKAGGKAYAVAPFLDPECDSIEKICDRIKGYCDEPGQKYIYAYWNQPDGLMHNLGTGAPEVHEALLNMEEQVSKLAEELDDTLLIVTADHGHLDNRTVVLQDYPAIMDCLVRLPAFEPRVLNFFVKEGKEKTFEEEFNKEFGEDFLLMPMKEAVDKKLFGPAKPRKEFESMLGNYLAIGISDLSIFFAEEPLAAMHGSVTEDEMLIPLIAFDAKG